MPRLTGRDVHVDAPLTAISIAFLQAQTNYLAAKVFPVVPVAKQSDRYFVYSIGDLLRDEAELRAPGSESAGTAVSIDNTPTYFCNDYAIHEDVPDPIAANADSPLSPKRDAAENVAQKLMTKSEVIWASTFFKASVWTTDLTATSVGTSGTSVPLQWGSSSADPTLDIEYLLQQIQSKTGFQGNTCVLAPDVYRIVKNHPKIIDRIKYTIPWALSNGAAATTDILAALWGLKRVFVAWAVKNTAKEGQTAAISNIFTNGVFVCYAADNPGIRKPSAGYTFAWNGYIGSTGGYQGGPAGGTPYLRMKQFRMEWLESDRVEGDMPIDHKLISVDLGAFIDDVLTT